MTKSKIEWIFNPDGSHPGYTSNPIKGYCPIACSYCYARRIYDRFGWDKTIRFDVNELLVIEKHKKPAGIFLGSTFELFWDGLDRFWLDSIFATIKSCPQHRFYLLTKCPQKLIKFLGGNITNTHKGYIKPEPLPDNVWIGVTVTDRQSAYGAKDFLSEVRAKVKFLSLEPLLGKMDGDVLGNIIPLADWVIIGAQTPKSFLSPKLDWILDIVMAADRANIPIFLKNNLWPLFNGSQCSVPIGWCWDKDSHLRQEMPKESQ